MRGELGESVIGSSEFESKENGIEGVMDAQIPELNGVVIHNVESDSKSSEIHGSSWVDILVQEMMNASDLNDVRCRTMKILESFEQMVVAHSNTSKEQLQCLLRDNQILRRAVAIQHERNIKLEEKAKEVQQLNNIISKYQEQLRTLELNNYTLKIHLQRAQEANSTPGRFHPDIF